MGSAQRCHHFGWKNCIIVGKGHVFTGLLKRCDKRVLGGVGGGVGAGGG